MSERSIIYETVEKPPRLLKSGDQFRDDRLGTLEVLDDPVLSGWGFDVRVIQRPIGRPITIWLDYADDLFVVEADAAPLPTSVKCSACGGREARPDDGVVCESCRGAGIVSIAGRPVMTHTPVSDTGSGRDA